MPEKKRIIIRHCTLHGVRYYTNDGNRCKIIKSNYWFVPNMSYFICYKLLFLNFIRGPFIWIYLNEQVDKMLQHKSSDSLLDPNTRCQQQLKATNSNRFNLHSCRDWRKKFSKNKNLLSHFPRRGHHRRQPSDRPSDSEWQRGRRPLNGVNV